MVDMTEELTDHYQRKRNWAGLSVGDLAKRYDCEMVDVRMAMGRIAQNYNGTPKQQPKGDQNRCKSPKCGMPILWIKTVAEKNMCVDPGGGVVIDPKSGEVVRGFVPHWATCKDPDYFRKKKSAS